MLAPLWGRQTHTIQSEIQIQTQIHSHRDTRTFDFHMLSLSARCGSCLDFYGLRLKPVVGSKHPSLAIESGRGVCFDCEDICETVGKEKWQSTMLFTQDTIDCECREDKDLGR